ncbi:MAG: Holliday junction branch migration protein RuvA [Myxococcales bacterium]|nr:Holliday junction branch migration protein RuvA [Myxococcales bacterium]MCB9630177.1 Holliday junction branch migration protein RuvA [Sandaracinaceae bacterium]
MIGRLRGVIVQQGLEGLVILEVGGVGYELYVPLGTVGRLPDGGESEVTLHVHTHVREDALILYAFDTVEDKAAFRALLTVNSIGPKLALSILSSLSAHELAQAIAVEDKNAFKGISGVGRKTVERILLDLKDKLLFAPANTGTPRAAVRKPSQPAATGVAAQVVNALVLMGYKRPDAERAVQGVTEHDEVERPVEVVLREALVALS